MESRPRASAGRATVALLTVALLAACGGEDPRFDATPAAGTRSGATTTTPPPSSAATEPATSGAPGPPAAPSASLPPGVMPRPAWLGSRVLPLRPDGFGEIQPTPPEMVDRRFQTATARPGPSDDRFEWAVVEVPADVLARSTWREGCPLGPGDLRYVTVSFRGFDGRAHIGELLVDAAHAQGIVGVFQRLFEIDFPIEEMRITNPAELSAPPTGDGNNTESFTCRPASGGTNWSQHAYGRAVDINPFHNPYLRGNVVLPELATSYLDRSWMRPGMVQRGDEVVRAFAAIGWQWGGEWRSLVDYMHFSANGR